MGGKKLTKTITMMTRSMTRIAELQARIVELEKKNERLQKQTGDLWELACFCDGDGFVIPYHQIEQLIEMRGESYVKEVFAEYYQDYKDEIWRDDEEDEDSDEEENKARRGLGRGGECYYMCRYATTCVGIMNN